MEAFITKLLAWLSTHFNWQEKTQQDLPHEASPIVTPPKPPIPIITPPMPTKTKAEILYETALASLHKDISPKDLAPDTLACMESMDGVWFAAFGEHLLPMPARLSTQAGYQAMLKDPRLKQVFEPEVGAIVISPTGSSSKGAQHGHVGCVGKFDIMSNDSNTGLWTDNYSKAAWIDVFHNTLGFPVKYFLPVG